MDADTTVKENAALALGLGLGIGALIYGLANVKAKPPDGEPPEEPPEEPPTVPGPVGLYGPAWVLTQDEWYAAGFTGSRYDGNYYQWKYAFELANPSMNFEGYVIANIGYDPPYDWWAYWGRYD